MLSFDNERPPISVDSSYPYIRTTLASHILLIISITHHYHHRHHHLSPPHRHHQPLPIFIPFPPQVIRTAQCRKCGLISHVRIQIVFDSTELKTVSTGSTPTSYSDRMTMLRYPTARMKSIRRALQASGHIIVGDGGAIKSNKGRTVPLLLQQIMHDMLLLLLLLLLSG